PACLVKYAVAFVIIVFFFSSRRRHTSFSRDWSSDVCSSDLAEPRDSRILAKLVITCPLGLQIGPAPQELGQRLIRIRDHCSEFVTREGLAGPAEPGVPEEDRTAL